MLQPTSCGPGPPDKTLEFNCKVLHEENDVNNGTTTTIKKWVMKTDAAAAVQRDGEVKKKRVKGDHRQNTMMMNFAADITNPNNNCHLKSIKFYSNQTTTAAVAVAASTATKTALSSFESLSPPPPQPPPPSSLATSSYWQFGWQLGVNHWLQRCRSFVATTPNVANFNGIRCNISSSSSSWTKWILMFLMLFTILAQTPHQVAAEKSKHYYMQSLCKNHFLQQLYRKIDGAVLWSQNERNLDCIITFQTHSILQRFMLRFDMLQLDCNDHLYIYDGAHAVATPKIDISCRQTKQTVSSILTRTNFVTLKYVTDNWGTDANGFKLVITSVKDPKHTCKDFTCVSNGFCIHPDLLCDGINHCSDNSDESVHNLCQRNDSTISAS